jgi:7-cyano-7-deazaguanine reductase
MAIAEGRVFDFVDDSGIKTDFLESFLYDGARQLVKYESAEFSCVCPFSGLPDFGKLSIEYIPDKLCVELKSLKYYLISYRNVGIYQEKATHRLFEDLYQVLKPHYLKLTTIYNTRGGIDATCLMEKGLLKL